MFPELRAALLSGIVVAVLSFSFVLGVGVRRAFCLFYCQSQHLALVLLTFPGIPPLRVPIRLCQKCSDFNTHWLMPL